MSSSAATVPLGRIPAYAKPDEPAPDPNRPARPRPRAQGTDQASIAIGTRPPGRTRPRRADRHNSRIGTAVGRYQVMRRLGSGGTSVVYLAVEIGRGGSYALKVMRRQFAADPDMAERFEREAVLLAHVPHPGLSRFVDRGRTEDGAPFLVMELLRGQTLARRLEIGPMAVPDLLDIALQAADALAAVHAAGVVHCDLKPDNLFLVDDPLRPSRYRVVIIDFGVASVRALHALKHGGAPQRRLIGTPSYMAPEQCHASGALDPRTDVYGLGCVLYEMLCGDAPFGGNIAEILDAQQSAAPAPPRLLRADTPEDLDALVLAMLAKDPDQRPSSMAVVHTGLASSRIR